MCGRFTNGTPSDIARAFEAKPDAHLELSPWFRPRWNVAPTDEVAVVVLRDGERFVEMMRWGLVPFWGSKAGAKPPLMINARVETIQTNRAFSKSLARKRCLVPADGFFEWKKQGNSKQPMYIHPEPRHLIAFAGLWASAKTPSGVLHSFTIITGKPNELVAPIHDRMPVVLDRSAWSAWLDPSLPAEGARDLLTVPAVGDWRADPVSSRVGKVSNDDPSLTEPVMPSGPSQGSLF